MSERMERALKTEISRQSGLKKFNEKVGQFNESKMVEGWKIMYEFVHPRQPNVLPNVIWSWINENPECVYWKGDSHLVGQLSVIKPYTDKKGVTKPAHFSVNDKYIGSCKCLGNKPVSYTCYYKISQENFNLNISKLAALTLFNEVYNVADLFTPKRELKIENPAEDKAEDDSDDEPIIRRQNAFRK
jgi:hypothetical protein